MTFNERHNEVMKAHAGFLNAVGVAAAGGGGFVAITNDDGLTALLFLMSAVFFHMVATEILDRLRIEA
jgi:hypothetical protein